VTALITCITNGGLQIEIANSVGFTHHNAMDVDKCELNPYRLTI
jgi:hypothetical protein